MKGMRPAKVFVVDDDASVRKALVRLLRSAGHQVESFPDAQSFMRHDREDAEGCLILDLQMPGLSGVELRKALKESGQSLPTIFITAFPSRDIEELVEESDVIETLFKPFDAERLLRAIDRALNLRSGADH